MSIDSLLAELHERTIAQRIGIPHDEARMRYPLQSNIVGSFDEFSRIISDYYNKHFTACVSHGGDSRLLKRQAGPKSSWSRNIAAEGEIL